MAHTTELRQAPKSYTAACPEIPGCNLPNMATVIIFGSTVMKFLNLLTFRPEKAGFLAMMVNDPGLGVYQEMIVKREEQILRAGPGSQPIIDTLAYTSFN